MYRRIRHFASGGVRLLTRHGRAFGVTDSRRSARTARIDCDIVGAAWLACAAAFLAIWVGVTLVIDLGIRRIGRRGQRCLHRERLSEQRGWSLPSSQGNEAAERRTTANTERAGQAAPSGRTRRCAKCESEPGLQAAPLHNLASTGFVGGSVDSSRSSLGAALRDHNLGSRGPEGFTHSAVAPGRRRERPAPRGG